MTEGNFEGTLDSIEPREVEGTGRKYAVIKLKEAQQPFSTFAGAIIQRLTGQEGKRVKLLYKISADGRYYNVYGAEIVGEKTEQIVGTENQETKLLALILNEQKITNEKLDALLVYYKSGVAIKSQ